MIRKWYGSCTEVVRKWYVGASRSQWELVGASDFVSLVLAKNDTFAGILLKPMKYIKLRHCTFRNVVFCYWYNEISTCLNMLVCKLWRSVAFCILVRFTITSVPNCQDWLGAVVKLGGNFRGS
jgi:hypothetical protein